MRRFFLVFLCSSLLGLTLAHADEQIPIESFLKRDSFGTMSLSPTGEYIAATIPQQDKTSLVILRRSDLTQTGHVTLPKNNHVADFYWVNPTRILFTVGQKQGELNQPRGTGEIFGVNADGKGQGVLIGFGAQSSFASQIKKSSNYVVANILDTLRDDDENVIVSTFQYGSEFTEAYKMNVNDGRRVLIAKAPVKRATLLTDRQSVARFATGAGNDNLSKTYFRNDAKSDWVLINDEAVTELAVTPLGFNADNTIAYLEKEEKQGPNGIYSFDLKTQKQTLLVKDNDVDPGRLLFSPVERALYGVTFMDGYPRTEYLDPNNDYAKIQKRLAASFKDYSVASLGYTKDGMLGLFVVYGDKLAGDFYLYNKQTEKVDYLAGRSSWLKSESLSPMEPYKITARDGTQLIGYLTVPKNSNGQNLPLIIHPHGGPFGPFDSWGYDPEVQLLANRGYAVLQVNFRGSGNYGRSFTRMGYKQWGKAMQDDLTDATKWAIKEGIADPNRICIYGASYGGYASLMGAAKEPSLYKCAIGNVGVYDMQMMYGRGDIQGSDSGENFLNESLGHNDLASISPNRLAASIKAPVLLMAGREDERAPPVHTEAMYRALQSLGKPVEMKIYQGEGHGNYLIENQIDFANRLLNFLDKHIGSGDLKAKAN